MYLNSPVKVRNNRLRSFTHFSLPTSAVLAASSVYGDYILTFVNFNLYH